MHSSVQTHIWESPALREMQQLSKEMETEYGPMTSLYKGRRAVSQISCVAGKKPTYSFKDAMP